MKKVYLLVLLCVAISSAWAQTTVNTNLPKKTLLPVTPNMTHHQSGGNRAANTISIDYSNLESFRFPGTVFYTGWNLNRNFVMTVPPVTSADTADNFTIRWASVKFDSIVDTDNDVSYNKSTFTSMTLDEFFIYCNHTNVSGLNDSLFITVYESAATVTGLTYAAGTGNNANFTPTNTILYRDTFVTNTSLTVQTPYDAIGITLATPLTIPQGKGFVIKVDYAGPKQDIFEIIDFNRFPCGTNSGSAPPVIPNNSARWLNLWLSGTQDFRGITPLTIGTTAGCQNYFFGNVGIGAVVTFDTQAASSCPSAATGVGEYRPAYNSFTCINQSTPYTAQLTFEVPATVFGLPVTSVRIDSILNLPCGITYTLNQPNGTYTGGSTGCITFSGTTTSPVGAYKLLNYVTANVSGNIFPSSEISTLGVGNYEYFLRVIANGATTCPTVTSGTTGLTANCTTTPPLTVTATSGANTICRGSSTSLTATAAGGTSPYTYSWSPATGLSSTTVSNPTASPTVTTTYTVTVTATGGATATASRIITVTVPSATITPSGPTTFCIGGSVTLSAPAGQTYLWSNGSTNQTISVTVGGTYSVTATLSGCTATSSQSVTVNTAPSATITGSTSICAGGSTTLSAPAGLTYQWSNSSSSQSITVNAAGTYSVTTTQNGCTATSSVNVTIGNPSATITPSGPTSFCAGGSVTLSAPAGFTYTWSANAGNATTQTINATQSGTYSVTVSAGGSCTATNSVNVTVNSAPSATITPSGPTTFCPGGSVNLSAPAGLSYLWSNNATSQSINATLSGSYSVTVTNANGCTATSSNTVTVSNAPSATITPNGPTTFCIGGSVTLSAPAGLTYTWSNSASTQSITTSQNGTYSVTVSNGTCTATSSVTVSVVSSPSATITPSGSTTFCTGGSVTLSAPSGYNYTWSTNANNATTQSVTITAAGTYNVTVSAGASCSATSSATVTVNTPPTVTISASGPTTFCTGGNVTLTASSGQSYLWSNGATQSNINATQDGTYNVTVTSANGCSGTASQQVTVVATPSATITPASTTALCPGSTVVLSAPAGFTYLWSNGGTAQTITAQLAGTYSVTVSSGSCTANSSITVTALTAPSAVVTPAGPITACAGTTITITAPAGLLYSWSDAANSTTQSISPTLAGSYTVTVTNANNCTAVSTPVQVTVANQPAKPTATFSGGTLSSSAAVGYQWYLNGSIVTGATSQNYTPTQNGLYSVIITDANGCSNESDDVSVNGVGITDVSSSLGVTVNPNPSTGMFFISTGNFKGTFAITILDMAGREVMTQTVNGQLQQYPLDMSMVGDGVYILRLTNGDATNYTRLVVY